jgi:hypothetical protein
MYRNLWRIDVVKISDKTNKADEQLYNWQGLHPEREVMFCQVTYVPSDHGFFWLHIFYREVPNEERRLLEQGIATGRATPARDAKVSSGNKTTETADQSNTENTSTDEEPATGGGATAPSSLADAAAAALKPSK